ncbi:MAG: hypothetical protein VYD64_05325 [Pseudomonadota bacterium]|nr:hypothetical protein [Pseudomonadota bacterium]
MQATEIVETMRATLRALNAHARELSVEELGLVSQIAHSADMLAVAHRHKQGDPTCENTFTFAALVVALRRVNDDLAAFERHGDLSRMSGLRAMGDIDLARAQQAATMISVACEGEQRRRAGVPGGRPTMQ